MSAISKRQLETVNRWLTRWKSRLLLGKWAMLPRLADKDPASKEGMVDMAGIKVDLTNAEAWLEVYPRLWNESKEYQEITIIHEMAHIHTEPIRILLEKATKAGVFSKKEACEAIEDLTNSVSKIVWIAYRRSKKTSQYNL